MKIEIERDNFTSESTSGRLFVNGIEECFSLEPPDRDVKPRCIPVGEYRVEIDKTPPHLAERFPEYGLMPHVLNVEGFDGIYIHPGNFPRDTLGCVLPGRPRGKDYVAHSCTVFEWLMLLLEEATDGITLTITGTRPLPPVQPKPQG